MVILRKKIKIDSSALGPSDGGAKLCNSGTNIKLSPVFNAHLVPFVAHLQFGLSFSLGAVVLGAGHMTRLQQENAKSAQNLSSGVDTPAASSRQQPGIINLVINIPAPLMATSQWKCGAERARVMMGEGRGHIKGNDDITARLIGLQIPDESRSCVTPGRVCPETAGRHSAAQPATSDGRLSPA